MEEVAALTPQDGLDFYQQYYSPENAILVVAGDVTADEVRLLAERHYGPLLPTGAVSGARAWQPVAPLSATSTIVHADPKVRQPVWSRTYLGTSLRRDEPLALALDVGLEVLGGSQTSRLYQALVERDRLAINVATYGWTTLHDEGPAVITATPADGVSLESLEAAVMDEIRSILETGFSEAETVRARNRLAAQAIYQRDSQSAMAQLYGASLVLGFSMEDIAAYPDRVSEVTPEAALEAVRRVFSEERHYITGHLLPADGDL